MVVLFFVDIIFCFYGFSWSLKVFCWCIVGCYNDEGCFRVGNSLLVWIVYIIKIVVFNVDGIKWIF